MKTLTESLFDKDLITKDIIYHPKTRDELIDCIKQELKVQGPNANLNIIDVSKITDMCYIFSVMRREYRGNKNFPDPIVYDTFGNINISSWDVRNVEDMSNMFYGCKTFNCDLSKWDVRNVKNMSGMFYLCEKFKGTGLNKWDVKNVENMNSMFYKCKNFNCDLSKWDVNKVENMHSMFYNCKSLKKIPDWYENS